MLSTAWAFRCLLIAAGAISLVGYAGGLHWLTAVEGRWSFPRYLVLFLGLVIGYLVVAAVALRREREDRVALGIVLACAVLFRLAVVPTPVLLSSDVYRYLWDGRVQSAGFNPYRYPPSAEELRHLRDADVYPGINRPDSRTVYPPGAEAIFAIVGRVAPDSLLAWRLFVVACDLVTISLVLALLRRLGRPAIHVIVYAWAPLAVVEGAQAGHVELVMLPMLLLAFLLRLRGGLVASGAVLGVAVLTKLYPALLLLAWWRRGEWRLAGSCALVVAAGYALYLVGSGPAVVGFLPRYFGSGEDFNIGLRYFVTEAIGLHGEEARGVAIVLLFALMAAVLVAIGRRRAEDDHGILHATMASIATYLLLLPTAMHAWYAVVIIPFLAFSPSVPWFWFTGAVTLSYLKYALDPAGLPAWARVAEYLPLYGLLLWQALRGRPGAALVSEWLAVRSRVPTR